MAIYKPGRLYRKLANIPKPLFTVSTANTGTLSDDQISSIIIDRGKSDNSGGVHPSTVEIALAQNQVAKAGDTLDVRISTAASVAIAARFTTDPDTPAYIAPRFNGRVGMQEMEDRGRIPRNTIYGASWSAQLSHDPTVHEFATGVNVITLLQTILRGSYLASKIPVYYLGPGDSIYGAQAGKFSDLIGPFASNIGILIQDARDGRVNIIPLAYRRDRAIERLPSVPPLTRSQALSPARWVQPNEGPPVAYRLSRRTNEDPNNILVSTIGATDGSEPIEEVDWSYFRGVTEQWRYIHAMRAAGFDDRFRIEEVTIDLLMLLDSPYKNHWDQAEYLLKLQPGDPVYLSEDWNGPLRGIHFAEGIREEIGSDRWNVTLSLIRFREIVGQETVNVPARVWNSAVHSWDIETKKWDEI